MHSLALILGRQRYPRWKSARIHRALSAAAGSFSFEAAPAFQPRTGAGQDAGPASPAVQVGSRLDVELDDEFLLARGVLDELAIVREGEIYELSFAGRDLPGQLVDCYPLEPRSWYGSNLNAIVSEIANIFGVGVKRLSPAPDPPFQVFALQPGETAWDAIERACRMRGILATSAADGDLALVRPGHARAEVVLREPGNVLRIQVRDSAIERYHTYEVRGQEPFGDWLEPEVAVTPRGQAIDRGVAGHRTRLILAETIVDNQVARDRARWEAAVAAARGKAITVTLSGWRQGGVTGPPWVPGLLVGCNLPTARVAGELLIDEVVLDMDESKGWTSELRLVRPDAYLLQPALEEPERVESDFEEEG